MITTRTSTSNLTKTMNSNSQRIISTIKQKVKNPMTGSKFTNNDQIVDLAIESFFERLKEHRLVWCAELRRKFPHIKWSQYIKSTFFLTYNSISEGLIGFIHVEKILRDVFDPEHLLVHIIWFILSTRLIAVIIRLTWQVMGKVLC